MFIVIVFSGLQTIIANDDLPYSFFYRGTDRIVKLTQILRNQISDYLTINGRFLVHSVVQFVLMYGKLLFSILNGFFIISTLIIIKKIVETQTKLKMKEYYVYLLLSSLFLMLLNYKYLIYWVAGSVNYVWVFTLIIAFVYYYVKVDYKKYKTLNCLLVFILSILHEAAFVFIIILLLFDLLYKIFVQKEKQKENYIILLYIFFAVCGGLILFLAPGNSIRVSQQSWWYGMDFIKRMVTSIPVVSKNLYSLFDINNLIPTIFLIILITYIIKYDIKNKRIILFFITILSLGCLITGSGWLYFALSMLLFLVITLISYLNEQKLFLLLTISFYAVVYSMILTPEFSASRPNYYFYLFLMMFSLYLLSNINIKKAHQKFINAIIVICFVITMGNEIRIFSYIGNIKQERIAAINEYKTKKLEVLECKKIKSEYVMFQADANHMCTENYWARRYLLNYYSLPKDTKIIMVD